MPSATRKPSQSCRALTPRRAASCATSGRRASSANSALAWYCTPCGCGQRARLGPHAGESAAVFADSARRFAQFIRRESEGCARLGLQAGESALCARLVLHALSGTARGELLGAREGSKRENGRRECSPENARRECQPVLLGRAAEKEDKGARRRVRGFSLRRLTRHLTKATGNMED